MNVSKPRILIAGAGIGGIVAALALLQRGFGVTLYEQVPELHELGAGIAIMPNGSRLLIGLGLEAALEPIASVPSTRETRLFDTGESWPMPGSMSSAARFGSPFWLLHRGDLHLKLASALEQRSPGAIHVGVRCVGFEQDAQGVDMLLETGEKIRGDALIGADGVHSRIRRALFGEGRATFTGFMAWRAVIPMLRLAPRLRRETFTAWLGPLGQIVTYPLRRGELLNIAATVERSDWRVEGWSEAGTVDECRRDFPGWHEDVHAMLDAVDVPYKWALLGRPPLQHCSVGRVTLLGDACHPTLPTLGQGGNMAIEDAIVLARCLDTFADIPEALQRYEVARLDRTSRIVLSSLEGAERIRNPALADPERARSFMDRTFGPDTSSARLEWLYEYDAGTTPI